jgi:hypothetical protein
VQQVHDNTKQLETDMTSRDYTIIDDSGILALVDCSAYQPFVSADWTWDERSSKPDQRVPDFIVEYEKGEARTWSGVAWRRDGP